MHFPFVQKNASKFENVFSSELLLPVLNHFPLPGIDSTDFDRHFKERSTAVEESDWFAYSEFQKMRP